MGVKPRRQVAEALSPPGGRELGRKGRLPPSPVRCSRFALYALRAERGHDLPCTEVVGVGGVARIRLHHDDLHDVARQCASRFGDLVCAQGGGWCAAPSSLGVVLVVAAPPDARLVASLGGAVEPLVHAPETVHSTRIGGILTPRRSSPGWAGSGAHASLRLAGRSPAPGPRILAAEHRSKLPAGCRRARHRSGIRRCRD